MFLRQFSSLPLQRCKCFAYCKQMKKFSTSPLTRILHLHERGILQSVVPEMSEPHLFDRMKTSQTVYCGFDPTADSLHIGNLLAIIAMIHCQRAGHKPIALVGGATARIGDPSGKTQDRDAITAETIEQNIIGISENLDRVFTNHELYLWKKERDLPNARIMNNLSWYEDRNIIDFLSTVGRFFRMGPMLSRHSVKTRLQTKEGMSFTEFTYQIFQANDWLHLLRKHECFIQIGGNDQIGNIQSGIDFIYKAVKERVIGITVPLVTSHDGKKLGKSEGNALWLDPRKTTPYQLYQFLINTSDQDVVTFLNLFTFLSKAELDTLLRQHKAEPQKRLAQKTLAENVLLLVHGEEGWDEAQRWTTAFFSNDPAALLHLSDTDMQRLFVSAPTISIVYEHGISVLDLLMKCQAYPSQADALHTIKAGGMRLNHRQVTNPDQLLVYGEHILPNHITLLKHGKKNYKIIQWTTMQ